MNTNELRNECLELAGQVISSLKSSSKKLAVAESCTGGLLSELITSISGSSEVFELGAVVYSERMKSQLLGIPPQLIEECGVVSREVALAMAYGSKLYASATIGVGITGIAGPSGGTEEQPVGTVYVSAADSNNEITANICADSSLSREEIRLLACKDALEKVLGLI